MDRSLIVSLQSFWRWQGSPKERDRKGEREIVEERQEQTGGRRQKERANAKGRYS
jgi:hypothetical protein